MTDYSNLPYKTIRLSKEAFEKIEKEEQNNAIYLVRSEELNV